MKNIFFKVDEIMTIEYILIKNKKLIFEHKG